jgi:hypothetical protein
MMHPLLGTFTAALALALPLLAAATAHAQPRDFKCIGAERLEDDVFEVPFPARSARPAAAARTPVAAAAALAAADPSRNICVLGHSTREGGQSSSTQLAARRAREVSEMLAVGHGIERDRIRAEARNPGFSRRTENREARSVTIVVLPSAGSVPEPRAPQPRPAAPPAATPRATPRATPPAATPPAATPPATTDTPARTAPPATVPPAPPAQAPAPAAPPSTTPPTPPAQAPAVAAPPATTPPAAPADAAPEKPANP